MIKHLVKIGCLFLLIHYVPRFCYDKTDGFVISNIHDNLAFNPDWEIENPPLEESLNQKFTYLSSGGQAYAFISEDQKMVLKFFKHHLRRASPLIAKLPLPKKLREKRRHHTEKRKRKLLRDYTSYKLSMQNLQDETGLLYVHLNKSSNLHTKVTIVDKLHIQHVIDLDTVGFVLQKKADLALNHLLHLIQMNEINRAKKSIDSICDIILSRCKKGIYDEDPKIHRNFGFVGDNAIIIDVGRLRPDNTRKKSLVQKEDLFRITKLLRLYLMDIAPELSAYLDETLERKTDG